MSLAVKQWRLETGRVVTSGAIRSRRARCELPLVRVFVTVLAEFVRDGAPKIAIAVTLPAA
jgi:hypothetical protein